MKVGGSGEEVKSMSSIVFMEFEELLVREEGRILLLPERYGKNFCFVLVGRIRNFVMRKRGGGIGLSLILGSEKRRVSHAPGTSRRIGRWLKN